MLPVQCRMARAALGLSAKKLAVAARVARQTIVRFERGEKIRPSTVKSNTLSRTTSVGADHASEVLLIPLSSTRQEPTSWKDSRA